MQSPRTRRRDLPRPQVAKHTDVLGAKTRGKCDTCLTLSCGAEQAEQVL